MSWRATRSVHALSKASSNVLPQDIKESLNVALLELLKPNDFVLYERHDPAVLGRMVRREEDRYFIRDCRTGEELWVGAESLLHHGKPIDEWFGGGPADDHRELFLPIYLSTNFDELVSAWEKVDGRLVKRDELWRLGSELKRSWVPRWGEWSEAKVKEVVRGLDDQTIISWYVSQTERKVLMFHTKTLAPVVATIHARV
jgi:hypothetical protein